MIKIDESKIGKNRKNILFGSQIRSINSIFSLINKYFWKNKLGPIIVFVFPLIMTIFLYLLSINHEDQYYYFAQDNIFLISISCIPICIFTMPLLIVEIKKSILLKKIAQAHISASLYISIISIYFLFLSSFSLMLTEVYWLCFMNTHIVKFFNIKEGGDVFYSFFCLIIVSISLGVLIGSLLKNTTAIPMLGIAILLITLVISGILSPTDVANVWVLRYINLFSPLNYPLILVNETFFVLTPSDKNIFSFVQPFYIYDGIKNFPEPKNFWQFLNNYFGEKEIVKILWFTKWQRLLAIFFPFLIFIGFNLISIRFFSWSSR